MNRLSGAQCEDRRNWWKIAIPWAMIAVRLALGPAMAGTARWAPHPQAWLGGMIAAGFLSDVFDGILARHWGTETARLRVADSAVDTVFYLGVLGLIVVRHWSVLRERADLLAVLLFLEVFRVAFDWLKFHRLASYHSYASKFWGILLAASAIALLAFDRGYVLVTAALAWGIICDVEGLTISILLPEWTHDVRTLAHALAFRRHMREQR